MAHAWIQAVDPMFAIGALDALADWEEMTGYEANARRVLTSWALRRRAQTAYACFLVKPGIVSMGVTVAVMTMSIAGMDVHSTTSRTAFREAMRKRVSATAPPQ